MPMNIQTALLPHKHVRFSESTVALAGLVRSLLTEARTVDELWTLIDQKFVEWPSRPSFTDIMLAVDVLFAIKQVQAVPEGRVGRIAE